MSVVSREEVARYVFSSAHATLLLTALDKTRRDAVLARIAVFGQHFAVSCYSWSTLLDLRPR